MSRLFGTKGESQASNLSKRRQFKPGPLECLKDRGQNCSRTIPSSFPPSLLSEYDVFEVIGTGGFSFVRKAVRKEDNTVVAVKISHCADNELRSIALEEHRILSHLHHRNIVGVGTLHECDGSNMVCLVLDFCEPGSIKRCIRKNRLFPVQVVYDLKQQLVEGVNYLHESRFVHRDLKPENLLLQVNTLDPHTYTLKIADFGCAKQIGCDDPNNGKMLTDRGSHSYAAPEVRFGLMWNERIDIWALGLCSYYMLTGRLPFDILEPAVADTLKQQTRPDICWTGISCSMKEFIEHCLTVKMEDRPSAMALRFDPRRVDPRVIKVRSWGGMATTL